MKYMLMMNATQADWAGFGAMAPQDIRAHVAFMMQLNKELGASGELVDAQGLTGPEQAKVVRARGAEAPAVTDGPFSETKEFLAGYWVLDCRSYERVIEIATHDAQPRDRSRDGTRAPGRTGAAQRAGCRRAIVRASPAGCGAGAPLGNGGRA